MRLFARARQDRPLEGEEKAKVIEWTREGWDPLRIADRLHLTVERVKAYQDRELEPEDRKVIRQFIREDRDSLSIARHLGLSVARVADYVEKQHTLEAERDRNKRRSNPAASILAEIQESIADEVAQAIQADPSLRRQLVKGQIDSVLHDLGAKKDPPKGGGVTDLIGYAIQNLSGENLTQLLRVAIPGSKREELMQAELQRVSTYAQQLEAQMRAIQAPAQLPAPAEPPMPPAEEPQPEQQAEQEQEVDWTQQMVKWIGMAPAVAAAEASAAITKPDAPIHPPFVTITPRQVLSLSGPEIVDLLTNNPAFRAGVPGDVRDFLATASGQQFWLQFRAALRLPEAA